MLDVLWCDVVEKLKQGLAVDFIERAGNRPQTLHDTRIDPCDQSGCGPKPCPLVSTLIGKANGAQQFVGETGPALDRWCGIEDGNQQSLRSDNAVARTLPGTVGLPRQPVCHPLGVAEQQFDAMIVALAPPVLAQPRAASADLPKLAKLDLLLFVTENLEPEAADRDEFGFGGARRGRTVGGIEDTTIPSCTQDRESLLARVEELQCLRRGGIASVGPLLVGQMLE